ncbi:hypothetical protein HanIR_Chr01g0018001 [Helianthus annuus]|nr:hypothetical protein HanIR_Chr01g0018001 [Helianthus annuus]
MNSPALSDTLVACSQVVRYFGWELDIWMAGVVMGRSAWLRMLCLLNSYTLGFETFKQCIVICFRYHDLTWIIYYERFYLMNGILLNILWLVQCD